MFLATGNTCKGEFPTGRPTSISSEILYDDTARRLQVATLRIMPTGRFLCSKGIAVTPCTSTILRINEGFGCQPKGSPACKLYPHLGSEGLPLAHIVRYCGHTLFLHFVPRRELAKQCHYQRGRSEIHGCISSRSMMNLQWSVRQ